MKKQRAPRIVPAPHNPENIPRSCWTCMHRGPVTADWCYCDFENRHESRPNIEPCENYSLDGIWIITDWCFV